MANTPKDIIDYIEADGSKESVVNPLCGFFI